MAKMKDCKVFALETRMNVHGCWTQWEDATPGLRYSHSDLMEFQDDLDLDACYGIQWRGRASQDWGSATLPLACQRFDVPGSLHAHTTLAPDECLPPTGWATVVSQLCNSGRTA